MFTLFIIIGNKQNLVTVFLTDNTVKFESLVTENSRQQIYIYKAFFIAFA